MRQTLTWIERALLATGVTLGAWTAMVLLEARFVASVPPPKSPAADLRRQPADSAALPGDAGTNAPRASLHVAPGAWLARLDAPSVHLSATVLEGSDDATLSRGAGHIEDTTFPGQEGNIGVAGHRDTTFRAVRALKIGDPLVLTSAGKVQRYRITSMKVVEPDDVYVLDPTAKPALTLVTCFPFEYIGHAPRRYIVRGELVEESVR